jgi:ribosome maturation factor RimP
LAEKKKGSNTVNVVWELARPLAEDLGLRLWDVRFLKEGATWYLRIIIDKEGGVSIDDCVALHHAIDGPLDELDPIEQSYNLQVSSAGIERELVRDEHFLQFIGADVKLKLQKAVDGVKELSGTLEGYENGVVTLRRAGEEDFLVDKKACSWVRLDDFEGFD